MKEVPCHGRIHPGSAFVLASGALPPGQLRLCRDRGDASAALAALDAIARGEVLIDGVVGPSWSDEAIEIIETNRNPRKKIHSADLGTCAENYEDL